MERYTLDDTRGDIAYEVDGDHLILKIRPEFISAIPVGDKYFLLVSGDVNTNPSDSNIMSSKRVLKEIKKTVEEYGSKGYWELILGDNEEQIIAPTGDYHVFSYGDVVAYATSNPVANTPVTGYDTFGLVKIASGGGLVVTDGVLSIDPSAVGGIDEEALGVYLTINKYIKEDDLKEKGYLALGSPITGYVIADTYTAITPDDTALTAIGKLERRFDGYVDLTTDQTIGGVKTFSETIYGGKDVVAYATSSAVATTPVASTSVFGLVKIGSGISVSNGVISVVAQQGGVQFTPGTALELTANSVLNVKLGDTANTVCVGNDSRLSDARKNPYELAYVYGSNAVRENGSYDGSEAKTIYIPTNASHIDFDHGYVTLSSEQTISAKKWFSEKLVVGPTNNVHLRLGEGSGNCINSYKADDSTMWNIYLNFEDSSAYTLIDPSHNVITTGDVVAYATSSAVATTPVASTSVFGLVKIGSGISVMDGVISVVAQQGGVQFTPGTALELTANSVLNVKLGDTANTVCVGNDSRLSDARKNPYELAYVYGSNAVRENGSYDGSEAKTIYIPTNASHITFDDGYVTLSSEQTISAKKWFSKKLVVGPTNNVHLRLGEGSGNCINSYNADDSTMWNIYLNFEDSSAYTLIDPSHNVITTGDVVAYATSSAVATTPVASTSVFGLVKIGSGISVSNGVISVSTTSSGSSSWNGGTVSEDITITKSSPTLRLTATNNSSLRWAIQNNTTSNLCFYNSKFGSDICAQVNYSTGAWTGNSDIRLKEIDGYETDILAKINGIDIIYYYWKFGITNRRMIGVGAQSVRRVLPELVSVVGWNDNIGDYSLGLDYAALGAVVAIGGLKELYKLHLNLANEVRCGAHWRTTKDEQIRQLQRECAELRVRINELEKGGAA